MLKKVIINVGKNGFLLENCQGNMNDKCNENNINKG
jgi:hypothetical protein